MDELKIKKLTEPVTFTIRVDMYIPIVVAMSSIQDVVAALSGGTIAVLGGVLGVALGFVFIPILRKFGA